MQNSSTTALQELVQFDKYLEGLETAPLFNYLKANKQLWKVNEKRQSFEGTPHKDTETIFLRGPLEFTRDGYQEQLEAYDYDNPAKLIKLVSTILRPCLEVLEITKLGYVLIVNLKAGGLIDEHTDEGLYAQFYDRFHIPIFSEEGNEFTCGDETVHMKAGELWMFNHREPHSVVNNSTKDRIHLIFDGV